MATNVTLSALYLGTIGELDTDETNSVMEFEDDLLQTFGSVADPLYKSRTDIITNSVADGTDSDFDDALTADHFDTGTPDTLTYDIGSGPVTTQLDSLANVTGTITFNDGSSVSDNFAVFQDQTGALFLTIGDGQTWLDDKGVVSFEITDVISSNYSGLNQTTRDDLQFVPCFTDDALILTPMGLTPITELKVGDLVMTRDHGPQPIRWIGGTNVSKADLVKSPNLQPYKIKADCFGPGTPFRDLTLSPQHRVLMGGTLVKNMFGESEMLIAVKHLEKIRKVQRPKVRGAVTYRHILFDRHEIIYANGLPTESLLIGQTARNKLPKALVDEIEALLPEIAKGPAAYPPARVLGRGHQGRMLTERLRRRRAHGRCHDATVLSVG